MGHRRDIDGKELPSSFLDTEPAADLIHARLGLLGDVFKVNDHYLSELAQVHHPQFVNYTPFVAIIRHDSRRAIYRGYTALERLSFEEFGPLGNPPQVYLIETCIYNDLADMRRQSQQQR